MSKGLMGAEVWAQEVFGRCELGDVRRTHRLVKTAGMMASRVGEAMVSASDGDEAASEGAYRLIRNQAVAASKIAEGGFAATVAAAQGCQTLLAVEDTTTLSYKHSAVNELGDLGGPALSHKRGFIVHSVLLVERESGRTVGLIEQQRWCRAPAERGLRHERHTREYEDKESVKWERASVEVASRMGALMAQVVSVCDREADVYRYLFYKIGRGERFVVRASWDRGVIDDEARHLFELMSQAPVVGEHRVVLGQRGGKHARGAREARLEVRTQTVTIRAPKRDGSLGSLTVNAVLAQELSAPADVEPAHWLLLTSEPIGDLEAARRVLGTYALRWRIEEFHKAWKSGTKVEQLRMQTAGNLERTATVLAFVAVRLLQLREAVLERDAERATQPCTKVLSEDEWRVLWATRHGTRPPDQVPTLRWAYESIAKLGGFMDTKRTGRAGWDTMWDGWFRLQERVIGYRLALGLNASEKM